MRILVVTHAFPPKSTGGVETYADAHACGLGRRGHDVTVIAREADSSVAEYATRAERRDGLDVIWINNTFRQARAFAETYSNPAIDAAVDRLVERFRPDVAHVHHLTCLSTGVVPLLQEKGIPVVYTLHDYWLLCHRGQLLDTRYQLCEGPTGDGCRNCLGDASAVGPRAFAAARVVRAIENYLPGAAARLWRRAAKNAASTVASARPAEPTLPEAAARFRHMRTVMGQVTQFLAPSMALRSRFIAAGLPAERIQFWPYGHDHAPFRGADNLGRNARGPLRVGFLGSVMISKAPHLVLEAVGGLEPGEATVDVFGAYTPYHGDDSYRAKIEPWLTAPNVRWHGPIAHDAVPGMLASIHVLVVPSIWPENSPLVIREAFLAGVPVVGSRVGGIPEAIADGVNGVLVAPGDSAGIREALRRLIDDPARLDRLRRGARESVVRSLDDDVEATERLYVSLPRARVQPRVLAAVVLHYGHPDETRLAVGALLASRRPLDFLIVVDNDPERRCWATLHDVQDQIVYLSSAANLGFSGGVNLGIREALRRGATRVFLVNNDVIVPPDVVGQLELTLDRDAHLGAVGPVVLSRCDPGRIASVGMSYRRRTGRMRHIGFGTRTTDLARNRSTVRRVDGLSGCALLVTRPALEATGLLDEAYFFGFEDLDWCLRARRVGFEVAVTLAARVHHEGGQSIGAGSSKLLYFAARNHLRLAHAEAEREHGGSALVTFFVIGLNIAHAFHGSHESLRARLSAVAHGARDHLAGRYGQLEQGSPLGDKLK